MTGHPDDLGGYEWIAWHDGSTGGTTRTHRIDKTQRDPYTLCGKAVPADTHPVKHIEPARSTGRCRRCFVGAMAP